MNCVSWYIYQKINTDCLNVYLMKCYINDYFTLSDTNIKIVSVILLLKELFQDVVCIF